MTTILDLSAERAKRERPDADCIQGDLNLFTIDYDLNGREFSVYIWAASFEDAEAHVEAIRDSAVIMRVKSIIPA